MISVREKIIHLIFGQGFLALTSILIYVIGSRELSTVEYATFRQSFLIIEFLQPILTLGFPFSIYYILANFSSNKTDVKISLLLVVFLSSLYITFIFSGGNHLLSSLFNNDLLIDSYKYSALYAFFFIPYRLLVSVLVYTNKTRIISIFNLVFSVLQVGLMYLSFVYLDNLNVIILLRSFVYVLTIPVLLYFTLKNISDDEQKKAYAENAIQRAIKLLYISLPIAAASIIGKLSMQLDRFLVSSLSSPLDYAVYVNGAIELPFVGVITGSLASVILAEMSRYIKANKYKSAIEIFNKSAKVSTIVLIPIMIFFIIFSKEFMIVLYGDKYTLSYIPFILYLLILPARVVYYGSAMISLGLSNLILKRTLFEFFINLVLSYLLIHLFDYNGAAVATIIVTYFWAVPYNIHHISKRMEISKCRVIPLKFMAIIGLKAILLSIPIIILKYYLNSSIIELILGGTLYSLLTLFVFMKSGYMQLLKNKSL